MDPHGRADREDRHDSDQQAVSSFIAQAAYELALMAARARLPEVVHYLNAAQLEAQLVASGPGPAQT